MSVLDRVETVTTTQKRVVTESTPAESRSTEAELSTVPDGERPSTWRDALQRRRLLRVDARTGRRDGKAGVPATWDSWDSASAHLHTIDRSARVATAEVHRRLVDTTHDDVASIIRLRAGELPRTLLRLEEAERRLRLVEAGASDSGARRGEEHLEPDLVERRRSREYARQLAAARKRVEDERTEVAKLRALIGTLEHRVDDAYTAASAERDAVISWHTRRAVTYLRAVQRRHRQRAALAAAVPHLLPPPPPVLPRPDYLTVELP
jgi:hypothetical protein